MIDQKLLEQDLIKPFIKQMDDTPSKYNRADVSDNPEIPSGYQAWLDDTDQDPHEVGLNSYAFEKHDAKYYFYTQMSDLMGANPYMPVVYNIDQYKKNDKQRNQFRLERLLVAGEVEIIPLMICFKKVMKDLPLIHDVRLKERFDEEFEKALNVNQEDYDMRERSVKSWLRYTFYPKLLDTIEYQLKTGGASCTGELEEFSKRLHQLIKNFKREMDDFIDLDIHEGNIMYRRTHTGVQMVISDPVIY